jgi:hypothetical protein
MSQTPCGESWLTPDEDNAWIGAFAKGVSAVPIVGGLVAGFIPPSNNLNSVRCIPGNKHDDTTGYATTGYLIAAVLVVAIVYLVTRK